MLDTKTAVAAQAKETPPSCVVYCLYIHFSIVFSSKEERDPLHYTRRLRNFDIAITKETIIYLRK